ncbi:glycosyl hydrolase [Bacteroides sp.]
MNFKKLISCVFLLCTSCGLLWAKDVLVEKMLTTDRTLDGAVDLHLTDAAPLASGVKVNITHSDGWLFFDNVRPLAVLDAYKNSILINGEPFEPETNGRISIYRHGTVIIPHGKEFSPLEAFTETDFGGVSAGYAPEFYYSNHPASEVKAEMKRPLTQDNSIRSFKLKRGYMATLATEPDGMGYSRCFIADDADLELRELPAELNGKVSFVRIFQWEWASKKGWVGGNSKVNPPEGYLEDQCDATNSTWVYCWGPNADWCRAPKNKGTLWRNQEFVPEKWGYGGESDWATLFNDQRLTHLLSYNEPDHGEQSSVSVSKAIEEWPKHLQTGMRVGTPATTDFSWLYNFMTECNKRNYRVDYVAIHAYWGGSGSAVTVSSVKDWYNKLKEVHEKTGRPLWITEWNNGANWTHESWPSDKAEQQEKQRKFMTEILAMMDTCKFIERYSVYNWVEEKRSLFYNNLNLTPAGKVYAGFNADMAFDHSTEVIPTWSIREAPVLSYQYNKEQNGLTLLWTDENCEQVDEYILERAIGGGVYEEIARAQFPQLSYTDPLLSGGQLNGSMVKYRVKSVLAEKVKKTSNEIQYGALYNDAQQLTIGRNIVPLGYNFYSFDQTYSKVPVMVLGTQTYRMRTPMTTRIRSLSESACEFGATTWNYNNTQTFRSRDTLSYMMSPTPGTFDLGGITAKTGRVAGVTDNSVRVSFESPFAEVPVVFASQVSGSNLLPTSVRVMNVTKEGFDVLLLQEENEAAELLPEEVCYIAMTLGDGLLGNTKIKVGRTPDGVVVGDYRSAFRIEYGGSYADAAFFGMMQTMNDQVASSLRAMNVSGGYADVFKERETSGGNAAVSGETVGWCVAETSLSTGIGDIHADSAGNILVYDDDAAEIRLLDGSVMPRAEVYAVTGRLLMSCRDVMALSVGSLPAGMYLVRLDSASGSFKFIKR